MRRIFAFAVPLFTCAALLPAAASCVGDDPTSTSTSASSSGASSSSSGASSSSSSSSGGSSSGDGGTPTCGVPGTPCCAGACQNGSVCNAGSCVCNAPLTACGTACVDTKTDVANCGSCGHDCFGGACAASTCRAFNVSTGQPDVEAIATNNGRAYWTRHGTPGVAGGVYSAKLDGSGDLRTHYRAAVGTNCNGIAFDGDRAYFTCQTAAGTPSSILYCAMPACTQADAQVAVAALGAAAIAVDPVAHHVFYTIPTPYNQSTGGGVFYLDGTNLAAPAVRIGPADPPNPSDVVVDGNFVYWLLSGTYSSNAGQKNGGVRRLPLGALAGSPVVVTNAPADVDLVALAADDVNVYFVGHNLSPSATTGDFPVRAAPNGGGGSVSTFIKETGGAGGFAGSAVADGTNVYYASPTDAAIMRCSKAGCAQTASKQAANEVGAGALAQNQKTLLWATTAGDIRRIAK